MDNKQYTIENVIDNHDFIFALRAKLKKPKIG